MLVRVENKKYLLHRLVAKTFVPNPSNLPEVNHKDNNAQNPYASNLEWCTRKDNLNQSYATMSPVRNFNTCKLYNNGNLVGEFQSISKACRYAKKHFGASESSLSRYLKWCDIQIVPDNKTGKYEYENRPCNKSQNRKPVRLYKNGYLKKECKTYAEMSKYMTNELGIEITQDALRARCDKHIIVDGYEIRRN